MRLEMPGADLTASLLRKRLLIVHSRFCGQNEKVRRMMVWSPS